MLGVTAVEKSKNEKIGITSATYVSQQSCPSSCRLRTKGCYANYHLVGLTTRRLNEQAADLDAVTLAENEASAIRSLTGKRPLRLHVVGDCSTDAAARIVSNAADEYRAKDNAPVWAYTHAWRDVARESWNGVSVLASCESVAEVKEAMAKGYGTAMVVAEHSGHAAKAVDGIKMLPCPSQTGKSESCVTCKLCFDADRLRETSTVICFEVHGAGWKQAQTALNILQ